MADWIATVDEIVHGAKAMRAAVAPMDFVRVTAIAEAMSKLPLPAAYVDGVKVELLQMLGMPGRIDMTSVYLAFYGDSDRANYLKIGVAKDVRARMRGIATGNPLPRLWTFEAVFASRQVAADVEAALIRHMSPDKIHGEWVKVGSLSEQAALAVVSSLAEVASHTFGGHVCFSPARE